MIYIFGHRNPDTDSICSAIALAEYKKLAGLEALACRLGEINRETAFILNRFQLEAPEYIEDVKTQIKDVAYERNEPVGVYESIGSVFKQMHERRQRSVAIVNESGYLKGLVTMHDIAMSMIIGDIYQLETRLEHVLDCLSGTALNVCSKSFKGRIMVAAYFESNEKLTSILTPETILIVGDRYRVIEEAILHKVQLILVSGNHDLPLDLIELANENGVSIVKSPLDTYTLAKLLTQCNEISTIAIKDNLHSFLEEGLLEVAFEDIRSTNFSNYPVVDKNNRFLGLIGRRHLMYKSGKKIIMVDHNEFSQSAKGIDQANIVGVVDHHRLGSISTSEPIDLQIEPVGSTCTVVSRLYRESNTPLKPQIAGILLSGILSDTLNFGSPTTTPKDREMANWLREFTDIGDLETYATEMFQAGTAISPDDKMREMLQLDLKVFEVGGEKFLISQIYTMDQQGVSRRSEEILQELKRLYRRDNYLITMLVVTNIVAKSSVVYYYTEDEAMARRIFGENLSQGMLLEGVVSRKKQIVPQVMQKLANG